MLADTPERVNHDEFDRGFVADGLLSLGLRIKAERFRNCGEGGRGWVGVCPSNHSVYCPFGCEMRTCPKCGKVRARELGEKLTPKIIDLVMASDGRLGLKKFELTTSVSLVDYVQVRGRGLVAAPLDKLHDILIDLRNSVRDLFRFKFGANPQVGWGIGCEFGPGGFCIHFHVLALCPYFPQRELSELWKRFSKGRGSVVWVEAVARNYQEMEKNIRYVTKYVTKSMAHKLSPRAESGSSLKVAAFVEFNGIEPLLAAVEYVLSGMRRFQTYQSFYDLYDGSEDDDMVCPTCGEKLWWFSELDWLESDVFSGIALNLLTTNKLSGGSGSDPPGGEQLPLFPR